MPSPLRPAEKPRSRGHPPIFTKFGSHTKGEDARAALCPSTPNAATPSRRHFRDPSVASVGPHGGGREEPLRSLTRGRGETAVITEPVLRAEPTGLAVGQRGAQRRPLWGRTTAASSAEPQRPGLAARSGSGGGCARRGGGRPAGAAASARLRGAERSAAQRQVRKGAGSPRAALDGSRRWWAASCRARRVGGMEAAAPLSPSSTAVPRSPFPGGSAHLPRGCGTWLPRPPLATSLGATPLSLALRLTAGLSGARFPRAALSAGRFPSAF